jgi:hypothetical protein
VQYGGGGELQAEEVLPAARPEAGPAREVVAPEQGRRPAQGGRGGGGGPMQRPDKVAQARGGGGAVESGRRRCGGRAPAVGAVRGRRAPAVGATAGQGHQRLGRSERRWSEVAGRCARAEGGRSADLGVDLAGAKEDRGVWVEGSIGMM